MATRTARTAWNGTLQDGSGRTELVSSGLGTFDVSWPKRTSDAADGTTSPEELIASLRASDLVVIRALEALVAAGLISEEPDGVRYMPVSKLAEDCVEQLDQLYRARPNAVRRAIVSAGTSSAAAFADAFKLGKD